MRSYLTKSNASFTEKYQGLFGRNTFQMRIIWDVGTGVSLYTINFSSRLLLADVQLQSMYYMGGIT